MPLCRRQRVWREHSPTRMHLSPTGGVASGFDPMGGAKDRSSRFPHRRAGARARIVPDSGPSPTAHSSQWRVTWVGAAGNTGIHSAWGIN